MNIWQLADIKDTSIGPTGYLPKWEQPHRQPEGAGTPVTRLYDMAAHCVPQCQGPLMDAQTPSGMFVTPVYGQDEEILQPTGSIWGGMCLGCVLFPDLMGISGLWASTQLIYGQGK